MVGTPVCGAGRGMSVRAYARTGIADHDEWARRLRVAGIDEPMLSEAQVSRLAWACGGQARLFMRLVRESMEK